MTTYPKPADPVAALITERDEARADNQRLREALDGLYAEYSFLMLGDIPDDGLDPDAWEHPEELERYKAVRDRVRAALTPPEDLEEQNVVRQAGQGPDAPGRKGLQRKSALTPTEEPATCPTCWSKEREQPEGGNTQWTYRERCRDPWHTPQPTEGDAE